MIPAMGQLRRATLGSCFARSFLIQGSWNYHTMLGTGFAFAILPALRQIFGDGDPRLEPALERHVAHFNAHPYLADVALGAGIRMEADGEDPETIRRFKVAVRGPLGAVGDALIWASLLPAASLGALAMLWLGAPGWLAVVVFLVCYNVFHVSIRAWGFRVGLRAGHRVGSRLGAAHLAALAERIRGVASLLLGMVAGAVLAGQGGLASAGVWWVVCGGVAFIIGVTAGPRVWRPAAVVVVTTVALLSTWGLAR